MTVRLIKADDWEGLYIDDSIFEQGHKLDGEVFLGLLCNYSDKLCGGYEIYYIEQEWIEDLGYLPQKFSDIPVEVLDLQYKSTK